MFAVVDTETTGFSHTDHVIEVGIAVCDSRGQVTGTWGSLIDPGRGVPVGASEIHGITREMLDGAPSFAEVAGFLSQILAGRLFVGHNASFDTRMLTAEYTRLGHSVPLAKGQYLCTMQHSRRLWPGLSSYKLGAMCEQLGIDTGSAHEALDDAVATSKLLRIMLLNGLDLSDPVTSALAASWPRPEVTPVSAVRRCDVFVGRPFAESLLPA
jgi:DNA polymerase-3 subunit epsilon